MLALLSVAHTRDTDAASAAMLVFDEIDAGIGGHTARAVGEHLRTLSAGRQVLCITHLPQVAALGARHFTIVKDGSAPARTTVSALAGDEVVEELVRMMGAAESDIAATNHARELVTASRRA
jgi:DNA repair protein RecN (Recombination protein N)